uniref:Uncharacterized protein n=1 Tax=Chlamydomonas leiostraca TaxID=1034604 RepID=A0A7S0R987_9CHLO
MHCSPSAGGTGLQAAPVQLPQSMHDLAHVLDQLHPTQAGPSNAAAGPPAAGQEQVHAGSCGSRGAHRASKRQASGAEGQGGRGGSAGSSKRLRREQLPGSRAPAVLGPAASAGPDHTPNPPREPDLPAEPPQRQPRNLVPHQHHHHHHHHAPMGSQVVTGPAAARPVVPAGAQLLVDAAVSSLASAAATAPTATLKMLLCAEFVVSSELQAGQMSAHAEELPNRRGGIVQGRGHQAAALLQVPPDEQGCSNYLLIKQARKCLLKLVGFGFKETANHLVQDFIGLLNMDDSLLPAELAVVRGLLQPAAQQQQAQGGTQCC